MSVLVYLIAGCSVKNNYESIAASLTEIDFHSYSGYFKSWVQIEEAANNHRTPEGDLEACVRKLSSSNFYQGSKVTKTTNILNCMHESGWKIEVEKIVRT